MSGIYPNNLLYAFSLPDRMDVVKVGKTEEGLARRLQDANSFHPFGMRFLAAWIFPDSQSVRAAEKCVRTKLRVYRSEWYSVALSNAVEQVSAIVNARPSFRPA